MSSVILKLYQRGEYNGKGQTETQGNRNVKTQDKSPAESDQNKGERKSNKPTAEMGMKGIKCYKCHKEGHIARLCPEANMLSMGSGLGSLCEGRSSDSIPWISFRYSHCK